MPGKLSCTENEMIAIDTFVVYNVFRKDLEKTRWFPGNFQYPKQFSVWIKKNTFSFYGLTIHMDQSMTSSAND